MFSPDLAVLICILILFRDQTKAELLEGLKVASDSQAVEVENLYGAIKHLENQTASLRCYFQVSRTLLLVFHV